MENAAKICKKQFYKSYKYKKDNKNQKYEPFKKKTPTWKSINAEVEELIEKYEQVFMSFNFIHLINLLYFKLEPAKINYFNDFPLSQRTLMGLKRANYLKPTEIQRESICLGLNGLDVLGAAKTGSGKTLAFLIPVSLFSELYQYISYLSLF